METGELFGLGGRSPASGLFWNGLDAAGWETPLRPRDLAFAVAGDPVSRNSKSGPGGLTGLRSGPVCQQVEAVRLPAEFPAARGRGAVCGEPGGRAGADHRADTPI